MNTEEPIWSPSQLEKLQLCEMRWWFTYKEGRREPGTDAATAGTKVHDLLEKYLRDGTPIDRMLVWKSFNIGEIAHDMCQFLPEPGTCPDVELSLELEVSGHKYRGRVDLRVDDVVYDHKTTSNTKRAKDTEKLRTDLQALIYARWLNTDGWLQWTTGQTKGPTKSVKHRLQVLKEDTRIAFDMIVTPLANRARELYLLDKPSKDIEKNLNACFLYPPLGCPFKDVCLGTNEEKINFMTENNGKLSLLEKLKLKKTPVEDLINAPNVVRSEPSPEAELPKKPRRKKQVLLEDGVVLLTLKDDASYVQPMAAEVLLEHDVVLLEHGVDLERKNGASYVQPMAAVVPEPKSDRAGMSELIKKVVEDNKEVLSKIHDTARPIDYLFLNCVPCFPIPRLHQGFDLIREASRTVCDDTQLHHIRLADFGKGDAMLAAQLEQDLLKFEPGFSVVLQSRTPEGRGVEQTLCSLAKNVIIGT